MKKLLCAILVSFTLVGCMETPNYSYNATIEDFRDCKFAVLNSERGKIEVIRCPNSAITTKQRIGKVDVQTVVSENTSLQEPSMTCKKIDGDIYKCKL